MKDLESSMLEEIEGYLDGNPQDDFTSGIESFDHVYYDSSDDEVMLVNVAHTEEGELFSYTIYIKEVSKFAFALLGTHPLFRGMGYEAF